MPRSESALSTWEAPGWNLRAKVCPSSPPLARRGFRDGPRACPRHEAFLTPLSRWPLSVPQWAAELAVCVRSAATSPSEAMPYTAPGFALILGAHNL